MGFEGPWQTRDLQVSGIQSKASIRLTLQGGRLDLAGSPDDNDTREEERPQGSHDLFKVNYMRGRRRCMLSGHTGVG